MTKLDLASGSRKEKKVKQKDEIGCSKYTQTIIGINV